MPDAFAVAALCLICTMLALLIKGTSPAFSFAISAAVCLCVLLLLGTRIRELCAFASEIFAVSGVDAELFMPLVKVAGIAILCHLSAALCRDAGETALASLTELAGVVSGLMVSFPLLEAVWKLLLGLL